MSTIQIDRLLDTVVKQNCSDLHLTTGRPPTVRLNGSLRNLQTKTLESDDMVALSEPVDGRLFFAGEGTNPMFWGCVHGALVR